jgi:hypothetical protein
MPAGALAPDDTGVTCISDRAVALGELRVMALCLTMAYQQRKAGGSDPVVAGRGVRSGLGGPDLLTSGRVATGGPVLARLERHRDKGPRRLGGGRGPL